MIHSHLTYVLNAGKVLQLHRSEIKMSCTCGRSPTGKCVGWHKLSEAEFEEKKAAWDAKQITKMAQTQ